MYNLKVLVKQWRRGSNSITALQNNLLGQTPSWPCKITCSQNSITALQNNLLGQNSIMALQNNLQSKLHHGLARWFTSHQKNKTVFI